MPEEIINNKIDSEDGIVTDLLNQRENIDIRSMIYTIRGQQVMLDADLAEIYGYEVKRLNEQVKRNIKRFPEDFMFQLTRDEVELVKSQIATSRENGLFAGQDGGRRKLPYAFTEGGIYALAGILRNDLAIAQHIVVIRTFLEMKKILSNNMYMLPPNVYQDIKLLKEGQSELNNTLNQVIEYISDNEIDAQKIFFEGQTYDAFSFIVNLIESANTSIVLIDGYTDVKTLNLLSKKKNGVNVTMYSFVNHKPTDIDIATFNSQYSSLQAKVMRSAHDRYLVIDDEFVYHIGASIKDAGKKSFAITRFEDIDSIRVLISRLDAESTT